MALKMWRKNKENNNLPTRIVRMDKPSLLDWYNSTLMELGASFDRYRHHGFPFEHVEELFGILKSLHEEIASRERTS